MWLKTTLRIAPENQWLEDDISFWDGIFSGGQLLVWAILWLSQILDDENIPSNSSPGHVAKQKTTRCFPHETVENTAAVGGGNFNASWFHPEDHCAQVHRSHSTHFHEILSDD